MLLLQNAFCIYSRIWWNNDFKLKILRKPEVNVLGALANFHVVRNLCISYRYCPHSTHLWIVSDDDIHQFFTQRGKLFRIKIACKLLEARVKQHLLYLRPHLYTINI